MLLGLLYSNLKLKPLVTYLVMPGGAIIKITTSGTLNFVYNRFKSCRKKLPGKAFSLGQAVEKLKVKLIHDKFNNFYLNKLQLTDACGQNHLYT